MNVDVRVPFGTTRLRHTYTVVPTFDVASSPDPFGARDPPPA
jgi:hypothetical protein